MRQEALQENQMAEKVNVGLINLIPKEA